MAEFKCDRCDSPEPGPRGCLFLCVPVCEGVLAERMLCSQCWDAYDRRQETMKAAGQDPYEDTLGWLDYGEE